MNSPGGDVYAGLAIYDAMQFVKPDVQTYCVGMAMSAGALILAGGAAGKRYVLPNSKVMIHQGSGGFRGTPADIQIAAREILSLTRRYAEIIAKHTDRDVEQVMRDIDRDRFLGPDDAVEYGLADSILPARATSYSRAGRGPSQATLSPRISSIRASVSALSSTPEAPALSSTCSGRDAPMIAAATFSSRSTHASASWAIESPSSSATGRSCCTRSSSRLIQCALHEAAHRVERGARSLGRRLAGLVLAR